MNDCLRLAGKARERGDHPVGSVVVLNNNVIGEGIEGGKTFMDITFHAEIEAIRAASRLLKTQDLSGTLLYTTHEPCIMCSYVIRQAKVKCVVVGIPTATAGGISSAYPILTDRSIGKWGAPPEIITGVMEEECRALTR